jgi:hypothetical protein
MWHRSRALGVAVVRLGLAVVVLIALDAGGIRGLVAAADNQGEAEAQDDRAKFEQRRKQLEFERNLAIDLNNLKQLGLAMQGYHDAHQHFPPAVVMGPDGKTPHSWRIELLPFLDQKHLFDEYRMNEPWDSPHNKLVLRQMPDLFRSPFDNPASKASGYYVIVGPRAVFDGAPGVKISDILDGASNTLLIVEAKRDVPWTKPEDISFDPEQALPELGGFVKGQFVAAMADGSARMYDAKQSQRQLKWLIMRNDRQIFDRNTFASHTDVGLRILSEAMRAYHRVYGHFPPAVLMGPDGKTPHSWRVELLPFLDDGPLYQKYDQNQPWDSEHNKKLLRKMPAVFRGGWRHDYDPESTNSSYFVLVGLGTVFEGPQGASIRDITDGTSSTVLIVQAKRDIPWTKPEDIAFDPDKPVPDLGLGSYISVAFADGAVWTMRKDLVKDQLKWMIMRNDGHVIEWWLNSH